MMNNQKMKKLNITTILLLTLSLGLTVLLFLVSFSILTGCTKRNEQNGYENYPNSNEYVNDVDEYNVDDDPDDSETGLDSGSEDYPGEGYQKDSVPGENKQTPDRIVFLTFDDGPGPYTNKILDILYEENVPAIFFLIGKYINQFYPNSQVMMQRIIDEGHYIGLHTMTHQYANLYVGYDAPARFVAEMRENQELVYSLVGHQTNLCRAPFGRMTGFRPGHFTAVEEAGLKCIDWNVDPQDWLNRDAQVLYDYVKMRVEWLDFPSELMILLHEYAWSTDALRNIIHFLRDNGYTFVTYTPGFEFNYTNYTW